MFTIFKYPLPVSDHATVQMPRGGQIIKIGRQAPGADTQEGIFIWAIVDPKVEKETRHFRVVGTGHPIETKDYARMRHLESVQLVGGRLVFHVFEIFSFDQPMGSPGETGPG